MKTRHCRQAKVTRVAMCIILYNILGLFVVALALISHAARAHYRKCYCIPSAQVVDARQTRPLRESVAMPDYIFVAHIDPATF